MRRVALVTAQPWAGLTADDPLLQEALRAHGVAAEAAVWDDPAVRWASFDLALIRSCWDYHLKPQAFASWLDAVEAAGVALANPAGVVRWNMEKRYLLDLQARGVAVVPTVWLAEGERANLAEILAAQGWQGAVVKPAVSASAWETWRVAQGEAAAQQPRLDGMVARGAVLVQPFVPEVHTKGEWSLIFFDKQFSHAVLKRPGAGDFRVQREFGGTLDPLPPPAALVAQAQRIVEGVEGPLVYARVDGVERDGAFVLMELELIEPFLFLGTATQAAERFAAAVVGFGAGTATAFPTEGTEERRRNL